MSRDRQMREMNGQKSFGYDLLVHYISHTGIMECKYQHVPSDHLVSTRETSTWLRGSATAHLVKSSSPRRTEGPRGCT